ncbi:MAG: tRNA (N(6)-L-threonylcarbamoyladenosine(37)-C(2))-methylthiotransferase MtaB [Deltaproteobacteria bacterium]|nr:tRNA (N(6)-L-threonylcarbamoyladenosine(37)-C(2))-methylthiotransferase MtaB [Deltaproteobacteria bacterium]
MRVAIKTLGCKINQYDSAVIQERLARESCSLVPFEDPADVYVLNTCTVTDRADWEARQLVRKARRRSPSARVVVTGCYAQVSPEEVSRVPGVDFVVGLNRMDELVSYVTDRESGAGPAVSVGNPRDERGVGVLGARRFLGRTRAFLKVQEGCNFACSYCIIPTARGRGRSVPPEQVLEQVRGLAEAGFPEIVLTGIHLGGYGYDLAPRVSLSALVRRIAESGLIRRLRLSSLDPREVTDELLAVMADSEVICPHLHVCVQAGEDGILKKMRRNYDTAYFARLMARARGKLPRAALGTDVIVGFPGETEAAFGTSLDFLEEQPLTYFHVFPYSARRGTPAADMSGQIPPVERKERSRRARELGMRKKHEFYRSEVGRRVSVLVEEPVAGEPGALKGYSRNYLPVALAGGADLVHREVRVRLQGWSRGRLWGEVEC